jgi:hypothetical protein
VKNQCDCIQKCLNNPTTCANYVYKFTSADSVRSGYRTCTLYSDFNLPADVTVELDLNSPKDVNIGAGFITAEGNNPHVGSLVPQAFMDINLNTTADPQAISGYVSDAL